MHVELKKYAVPLGAFICLMPFVSAGMALVLGIAVALLFGNAYAAHTKPIAGKLLPLSVIGLGAAMNLQTVLQTGVSGIGYSFVGIAACMLLGWYLLRAMKVDREAGLLITAGTAICGGSAIAAVAPVLHAKHHNITVALAVVFCLNALALLVFPLIGHWAGLSQEHFGLWAALAIHDTSSVVGAGLKYGPEALEVATTVKLARALWIVPLVIVIQLLYNRASQVANDDAPKRKYPWFILGFLLMAALVTYVPQLQPLGGFVAAVARQLLVLTLFLIGAGLTLETLKAVGIKPLVFGAILWVLVGAASLAAIYSGYISL